MLTARDRRRRMTVWPSAHAMVRSARRRAKAGRAKSLLAVIVGVLMLAGASVPADNNRIEDLAMQPDTRWRFFTDTVMGGVSTGRVAFAEEDGQTHARMTGRVSTANRGGFIQMRMELESSPPEGTAGVRLVVRGNDERYFVHLRSTATVLPWQYHQAGFDVSRSWTEVRLPFDAFRASGALLRTQPRPGNLRSIAVVAYGRDHDADIEVREVGFY